MTDASDNVTHLPTVGKRKLIEVMADRVGLEPTVFRDTLARTVMPAGFSPEEFAACLLVANKYDLDPLTKQIYFMKTKGGGIQPIVSVDGWAHIVNRNPAHDGMTFTDKLDEKGKLHSITCSIRRKDRAHPIEVTEYLDECRGESPAWKKTPARMLRHRAMMQCARYAYGIAGVMDRDEYDQWQDKTHAPALQVVSEADMPTRKSSAASKRDGTQETFAAIQRAIAESVNIEMLDHVLESYADELATMPMKWHELIQGDYDSRRDDFKVLQA